MATDQTVKVVLQGQDNTGPAFKSASKNTSLLNRDVSGLAKTLAGGVLAGGAAVTAFLYSAAKGAAEAQASIARVDSILETMGVSALKNRDALLENAQAAVKLGFDDEAAAESIARFYQRTNDLTEATKLNALAMDLARAKNVDLDTASRSVGLALAGNTRVLKEFGIELADGATKLEVINALQEKVGGTAENVTGTFAVQMQVLNETISNLKDSIGTALIEAILPFLKQFSDWAARPDVQLKIQEISLLIKEWAEVIIPVAIETAKIWYAVLKTIVDVMITIGTAINDTINAIARFSKAVKDSPIGKGAGAVVSGVSSAAKFVTGARASGGPVMGGASYLVGERGPEIFTPSTTGSIIPNGGGAATFNIYVSGNTLLDDSAGEKIGKQLMRILEANLRI